MTPEIVHDQVASGVALGVTAVATGVSLAATLQIIQILAGLVAIASGCCACYYYLKRAKDK